jgi:OpgC protein
MAIHAIELGRTWQPAGLVEALRALLASWRYATAAPGRDLRLDFLRGFCVFAMVVDHIGGTSWLYAVTGGNTAAVSAAEGFVFLSGLVMGIVYREKIARFGLRAATWAMLRRARTLYALTVSLTLILAAITAWTDLTLWVDRSNGLGIEAWPELIVATLTLRYTWHGTDILALYTVLVAAAPLIFFLMVEGRTGWALTGSWGLWVLHHAFPSYAQVPWPIQHAENFPIAAWQALFVTALAAGYHRPAIEAWLCRALAPTGQTVVPRAALAGAAGAALALGWVWGAGSVSALTPGAVPGMVGHDPFDKVSLGPGRVALFLLVAAAGLAAASYGWKPLHDLFGWALIPLGQASLYVYAMHLFLLLAAYNVPPYVGSTEPGWELHNSIGQIALVLMLWAMVRTRFLFRVVPR